MNIENKKNIDALKINQLLGQKEQADKDVRDLLEKYAIFKSEINGVLDSNYADARIVAVLSDSNAVQLVRSKVKRQQEVNAALCEAAPMYFKDSAQAFRTPVILNDIVKMKVSINDAVGSTKRTAESLIARYDRLIRKNTTLLSKTRDEFKQLQIKTMLERYIAEREQFAKSPDKCYRLRTFTHTDTVALYLRWGGSEIEKERVTAGGLFVVKHSLARDEHFGVIEEKRNTSSIYDELTPIENSLGLAGLIYDEDDCERLRNAKKRDKSANVEKIRPQGDDKTI